MFRPYDISIGKYLVSLARRAVERYLRDRKIMDVPLDAPDERLYRDTYGVFTTIERVVDGRHELRGCIGFPRGQRNVLNTVVQSAIAACCSDPRFRPMTEDELGSVVFEVSVLGPIREAKPRDPRELLGEVSVGVHGIIVERSIYSGLLLPQVPVEYCWDTEEYLSQACMKAMLPADCWLDPATSIYVYEAQIFREERPGGPIYERDLIRELERCGQASGHGAPK